MSDELLLQPCTARVQLLMPPALLAAAKAEAGARGLNLSAFTRLALAREIEPGDRPRNPPPTDFDVSAG